MVKKVVDPRINTLIKNGVQKNHRSLFVLIGDKGKDQIVNLHWMLTQSKIARPSVLWCYKKELGFTSHRKKRENKIKRDVKKGIREANNEDPFEMFITLTDIRYTYYKETDNILGNTFGMCVLQDFEALTPNLLAKTIETVEGGGIIVLLLKTMKSLKQLYTLTMDVHSRYRTEAHNDVVGRFNERFILSLADCKDCLFIDDELNVLPLSLGKNVKTLTDGEKVQRTQRQDQLIELKRSLEDTQPVGPLIKLAKTLDQAKTIMQFADTISEKTLRATVSLTAGRGRGKSASLGLSLACAVAHGYSNIFVTSPSPSNLKTLFEFLFKGFDALGYEEHLDYDIVMSTNDSLGTDCVVRVNIFRQHRQTIQYIVPQDSHTLAQAELVVIDEAAAIPLTLVSKLLGPYLVFMASTINGYEGTGRSLSLKLVKQLREQSVSSISSSSDNKISGGGRQLKEIALNEPIRYSVNDRIESWLNNLLCLDASVIKSVSGCPHPEKCELFIVNRDTLFSYHPVSEAFLQKMVGLYVSSHYKNSPNDLQLMSDAPAHELFVLLPPVDTSSAKTSLPEPLCVIQVSLEGQISKDSILHSLSRGMRSGGDLIPWLVSQQYQDENFGSLSGARIVRIATHPDYSSMGYGTKALELLEDYYSGKILSINEGNKNIESLSQVKRITDEDIENLGNIDTDIKVRDLSSLPPLFLRLSEKPPGNLNWLGTSYGLTHPLFKFWKKSGYAPVYLRQTASELTGEHTVVMLKGLSKQDTEIDESEWLGGFTGDFVRRITSLFGFEFKKFPCMLGISILESAKRTSEKSTDYNVQDLKKDFLPWDIKRLESYANNILDYHVVLDLMPKLASVYFLHNFGSESDFAISLSGVQQCVLLAIGLQHKTVDDLVAELGLNSSVVLAMLMKIVKKFVNYFNELETRLISLDIPSGEGKSVLNIVEGESVAEALAKELDEGKLGRYEIKAGLEELTKEAAKLDKGEGNINTIISVKSVGGKNGKTKEPRKTDKESGIGKNDVVKRLVAQEESIKSKKKAKMSKKTRRS
ncbi:hypothetical protein BB559_007081 [Furculomyces boomerangus]|uniref:RNA cytidine acetyltransferase n=2 Tax=Harpellales TaxID=61421 RepID=A0A2T9XZ38_9FUNG|nr:hypothetical protein BB559_007081 [Furculomyces boomerangus]PWA00243.1 hypothetical protein BB558_003700 [Smittium angustum]